MLKKLRLGKKLMVAFLLVGLVPFTAASLVSLMISERELSDQAFSKLTAVRDIKTKQIQDYFEELEHQMVVFSSGSFTLDAMVDFTDSFSEYYQAKYLTDEDFKKIKNELQDFYNIEYRKAYQGVNGGQDPKRIPTFAGLDNNGIALQYDYVRGNDQTPGSRHLMDHALGDKSGYSQLHYVYQPTFRKQMMVNGYRDILLIEARSGTVIYSTSKEISLGTSLIQGPLVTSGLGKAFKLAMSSKKSEEVIIVDFSEFEPAYNIPVGFIASPVVENGRTLGVAVFAIELTGINAIMSERTGMGRSGETYLVGPDKLMRSDSFLDPDTYSARNSHRHPEKGRVNTNVIQEALDGEIGLQLSENYLDQSVLSAFRKIETAQLGWALLAEISQQEAFGAVSSLKWIMGVLAIAGLTAVIVMALVVTRAIVKPINGVVEGLTEISQGEGDLTMRLEVRQQDEIGILAGRFNEFMEKLHLMIQNISSGIETLASSSVGISDIAEKMAGTAAETSDQSDGVEDSAKTMSQNMESVSAAVEQSSVNSNMVASSAEEMSSTFHEIEKNVEQATEISSKTVEQATFAAQKMAELGEAGQAINKVTETINEISDQTNLLALNATIEAARAGEAGKGFAVVANEIKELAKQTADATLDIKEKIEGVQETTASSVDQIDSISKFINDVNDTIGEITSAVGEQSRATEEIAGNIAQVSQGINEVSLNVTESASASSEITIKIGGVNLAATEIAGGSSQLKDEAVELADLSNKLRNLVGRFKT